MRHGLRARPVTSCGRGQDGGGRARFWGKRREADWQAHVRAGGDVGPKPSRQSDGAYLVHPCAHLAWTSRHRGALTPPANTPAETGTPPKDSQDGRGPVLVDFGVSNSAQCTLALPVKWREVDRMAELLAAGTGPGGVAMAIRQSASGWWQVADVMSLETVLAHALLDLPVRCMLLQEGQGSLGVGMMSGRLPQLPDEECAVRKEEDIDITCGLTDFKPLTRSRVTCMCDPSVLMHSRWEDSCCWPKVWALRQVMRECGDDAWGDDGQCGSKLGTVPIHWSAEDNSWVAGNRHRVVASLLAQQPLLATLKAKQVVAWKKVDRDGELMKWPAKLWKVPSPL